MAKISVQDVMTRLADGTLRPEPGSTTYSGMTRQEVAEEYLRRCATANVCAGCYNPLLADDLEFSGQGANICISCACY